MKTQADIRAAFWQSFPQFRRRFIPAGRSEKSGRLLYRPARQNDYPATVRSAFVDYVDHLNKSGTIPAALAQSVTL